MTVINEIIRQIETAENNAAECWANMNKWDRDPAWWGRQATMWETEAEASRREARIVWGWYIV